MCFVNCKGLQRSCVVTRTTQVSNSPYSSYSSSLFIQSLPLILVIEDLTAVFPYSLLHVVSSFQKRFFWVTTSHSPTSPGIPSQVERRKRLWDAAVTGEIFNWVRSHLLQATFFFKKNKDSKSYNPMGGVIKQRIRWKDIPARYCAPWRWGFKGLRTPFVL